MFDYEPSWRDAEIDRVRKKRERAAKLPASPFTLAAQDGSVPAGPELPPSSTGGEHPHDCRLRVVVE